MPVRKECGRISLSDKQMYAIGKQVRDKAMKKTSNYFVVREKAVPEVLLKVLEAKKLVETRKAATVQEAAEQVGISRSSFYKYNPAK